MKRSEALAILSRDHHQALVVAQKLSRADSDTAIEVTDRFREFWEAGGGRRHFQVEEELLLPAYSEYGEARHPVVLQVLGDHVEIRAQANRVISEDQPDPDLLHTLGGALAAHVRLEERKLFPLIEDAMPSDELLALAHALERAAHEGED